MSDESRTADLTPGQACALLGLSTGSLRALSDSGDLQSRRTAGGHRRFAEADVLAYRERHGTPRGHALRERVWVAAALAVLRDAEADLGDPAAARFRAAAELLDRP